MGYLDRFRTQGVVSVSIIGNGGRGTTIINVAVIWQEQRHIDIEVRARENLIGARPKRNDLNNCECNLTLCSSDRPNEYAI